MLAAFGLNLVACDGQPAPGNIPAQATPDTPSMPQGMLLLQQPIKFTCEDQQRFTIAFARNQSVAMLQLAGQTGSQMLTNSRIASGIEYGNANYVFREHQGAASLTTILNGKEVTSLCRKN